MIEGIHVVVFCAIDYEHMVSDHLQSVDFWVGDRILSKTVISNAKLRTDEKLVLDRDFWNIIDPNFHYANMYKHNWIRQQILKLNLHRILNGNILISDVEVIYQNPMLWCDQNRCVQFYRTDPALDGISDFVETMLGCPHENNFLTESMIFNTDILQDLQNHIESRFYTDQLTAYRNKVFVNPCSTTPEPKMRFAEWDLYNTFLATYHQHKIWKKLIHNPDIFFSRENECTSWHDDSMSQWINWYEQIKDPSWPDCYRREDFFELPEEIQKECKDIFGYKC